MGSEPSSDPRSRITEVPGHLDLKDGRLHFRALAASPHTLYIEFLEPPAPPHESEFLGAQIVVRGHAIALCPCKFLAHPQPNRRAGDPSDAIGDGQLVFLEDVYDFTLLFKDGAVTELAHRLRQLNVVWGRKAEIIPAFRNYTADLVYDLQVYRAIFDAIDRDLEGASPAVIAHTQNAAIAHAYPRFRVFLDKNLERLQKETHAFSKQEHERHGFYFRKHLWDVIMASRIMQRTNLKPRGYAGDSVMMRLIYEMDFVGTTIFAKMMHYHPLETPAAQSVRNRAEIIAERLADVRRQGSSAERAPLRVMSVACGPAWELRGMLSSPEDFANVEFALLDQDREALDEAESEVRRNEQRRGARLRAFFICDSVRTMLRTPRLSDAWGHFDFLYSMGLFDYLIEPVARAVLAKLYELLRPGGEILLGNFHPQNPTRTYMEYWLDWVLFYRSEEEFLDLAYGLPGAEAAIRFEDTGCQMFLTIKKTR